MLHFCALGCKFVTADVRKYSFGLNEVNKSCIAEDISDITVTGKRRTNKGSTTCFDHLTQLRAFTAPLAALGRLARVGFNSPAAAWKQERV